MLGLGYYVNRAREIKRTMNTGYIFTYQTQCTRARETRARAHNTNGRASRSFLRLAAQARKRADHAHAT